MPPERCSARRSSKPRSPTKSSSSCARWSNAGPVSPRLPAQHEVLARRLAGSPHLSAGQQQAALGALARTPPGDRLCHGDFHPGNILLTDGGEYIIDWVDATCGSPAADVARSCLLFLGHIATTPEPAEVRAAMQRFHDAYLARYAARSSVSAEECRAWLPILAATRLREGIPEQREWLLAQVRQAFGP